MKKFLIYFLFVFLFVGQINAQTQNKNSVLRQAIPETEGFSSERLKRIDNVIQEYVDKKWCAGTVALVARNGKIIYYKAIGYDDIENKTPLKKDVIFRIASQTKAITSVAVMILYEEGKFLLDDPISRYIPEFKNAQVIDKFNGADTTYTTVKAKREISIRDLLTHTSGIGYAQIGSGMMNAIYSKAGIFGGITTQKILLRDQIKKLGSLPLFHQPGEKFTYGLSVDILGYLVEVLSGMSLDEFFHKRIFEPLGMSDTYFYLPKGKQNRLATLYTEDDEKHIKKANVIKQFPGIPGDYPNANGTYFSGGAGLSSTVYDYVIFLQMILNGGEYNGKRILSPHTIHMMTMNQIGDLLISSGTNKFGLGFEVVTEYGSSKFPNSEGTFDWGGIFGSTYWVDPKEKIVVQIVLQQYPNSHSEIENKFRVLVYQALMK